MNAAAIARYAAVGAACLVLGFLLTWFLRPSGGNVTVLPTATVPAAPASTTAAGTTVSTTATPPAPTLPKPAAIRLAVLNGTAIAGFAAKTATRAQGLGYPSVATGNAPTSTDPTTVYFRAGKRSSAQRVAQDMGFTLSKELPATGAVATAAPATSDVILVLGAGN